jgi:hypothetical protein
MRGKEREGLGGDETFTVEVRELLGELAKEGLLFVGGVERGQE